MNISYQQKQRMEVHFSDLSDLAELPIMKNSIEFETNYIFEPNS